MNKCMLVGRLATDPELRTTQSGLSVCQFRLAVQRPFANQQGVREADFIPIVVWKGQADACYKYLSKGRQCAVVGTIQTRSYDAQDGTKRYVTEVIASEVEFISSGEKSADAGAQAPKSANSTAPAQQPANGGFEEIEDDELPFD